MPEGVEVRLTAEEVSKYIINSQLVSIEILSGRYKRHGNPQGFDEITSQLPLTINKVCNKGKGIFFHFDKDWNHDSKRTFPLVGGMCSGLLLNKTGK